MAHSGGVMVDYALTLPASAGRPLVRVAFELEATATATVRDVIAKGYLIAFPSLRVQVRALGRLPCTLLRG